MYKESPNEDEKYIQSDINYVKCPHGKPKNRRRRRQSYDLASMNNPQFFILELLMTGLSMKTLAEEMKLSTQSLSRILDDKTLTISATNFDKILNYYCYSKKKQ